MVIIRIKDYVAQASSYDDGQVIFDLIYPDLRQGKPVEVSFEGIHAVPSAFINAALVQLVEVMPLREIFRTLRISNSTKFINDMIKRRFDFVSSSS